MRETLKISSSFYTKMGILDDYVEEFVSDKLIEIAQTAVSISPVDTGAYVTSFSYSTGAGRPRGKSSDNLPKKQNVQSMQQSGLSNLMSDIDKLELKNTTSITLRNNSPHADKVENGGPSWKRRPKGDKVFATIRNLYG
tara:strand:- start:1366 stop:1782 length:417 start_codon:yes stop_codon:yes gene_type:complete